MTDVRLVATNPEDSTLVPVGCNSRGEILIVEPTIEKISNDVEIEGDLTVTGTISGADGEIVGEPGPPGPPGEPGEPGPNVLLPYGPEGSVLIIQNGVPTWSSDWKPPEPPAPPEFPITAITDSDNSTPNFGIYNDIEQEVFPPDWDEFARSTDAWTGGQETKTGIGTGNGVTANVRFRVYEAFNQVLTFRVVAWFAQDSAGQQIWTANVRMRNEDDSTLTPINTTYSNQFIEGSNRYVTLDATWLVKRSGDVEQTFKIDADLSGSLNMDGPQPKYVLVQSWTSEPASRVLLDRLREAGSTTDID